MEKQINQQQTLFRFISIRPPELTDTGSKLSFVQHPGESGVYFNAVSTRPTGQTKWEAMQIASQTFTAYDSVKTIETKFSSLSKVSGWLAKNKDTATPEEIKAKVTGLTALSAADILTLWDNLFYQVIMQKDYYVKDLIAQLLILQNLLDEVKRIADPAEVLKVIKQLADTSVVLPVKLFSEDNIAPAPTALEEDEPLFNTKQLNQYLDNSFFKYAIKRNNTAVEELKKLEFQYGDKHNSEFVSATKQYQEEIESAISHATYTDKEVIDCPSGCPMTVRVYENLEVPKFPFTPPVEINPAELKAKLSEESYYVVESLGLLQEKTFNGIIEGISNSTKTLNNDLFLNAPTQRVVAFGNMVFADNGSEAASNLFLDQSQLPYVASYKRTALEKGKVFMSVDMGYAGAEVAAASYTARVNQTDIKGSVAFSAAEGNVVNLILFPENNGLTVPKDVKDFNLDLKVTLTDATTFTITKPITVSNPIKGVGTIISQPVTNVQNIAFKPKDFGFRRLGIADYKKVVNEVCCYREAEVSHIENIMAREFRSKSTTRERIEETTVTTENQFEQENYTDVATSERFEMQREVGKVLNQNKEIGAYGKVWGSMQSVNFEIGGTYASSTAKEESNRQAVIQSREVTERASERITTRFREELVRKITERFREDNSHVFDNREGENHVSGVYRFINAIYKNSIFNYGKRLMYEFMVPEPGKLHTLGSKISGAAGTPPGVDLEPPHHPSVFGLIDSTLLVDQNYMAFAAKYDATVEAPPLAATTIGKSLTGMGVNGPFSQSHNDLKIPEGYRVVVMRFNLSTMKTNNNNLFTVMSVGDNVVPLMASPNQYGYATSYSSGFWYPTNDRKYIEAYPVSVMGWDLGAYTLNITLNLERTEELFQNWQIKTYNAIVTAYHERLAEYNERVRELQEEQAPPPETVFGTNPLFYREIEEITLKRSCISYLLENNVLGVADYSGSTFTEYHVTRNQQMDNYTSLSKFMEQAFEWDIMSYGFYPYYWASKTRWLSLYQTDNDDAQFREFMQAGMARVIVTVRPGFEKAVMYFMATGRIWNGGEVPVLGDPLYQSIVDELKEQEYTVEETWETVVPTSLIGLQKSGVAIDMEGLPCGGGCEIPEEPNPLVPNNSKLGPEIPPTA